jgi:hypothetical protein
MDNVTMEPANTHPDVPSGEVVVMEVVDRNGQGLFFTGSGFAIPGHGFVPYKDISGAGWANYGFKFEDKYKIEVRFTNSPLVVTLNIGDYAMRLSMFINSMAMTHKRFAREQDERAKRPPLPSLETIHAESLEATRRINREFGELEKLVTNGSAVAAEYLHDVLNAQLQTFIYLCHKWPELFSPIARQKKHWPGFFSNELGTMFQNELLMTTLKLGESAKAAKEQTKPALKSVK